MIALNSYKYNDKERLSNEEFGKRIAKVGTKFTWFLTKGYTPHYYQTIFHTMTTGDHLTRFRHLVAGRRGGKTLSASWETLFYCLFPSLFHQDAHGEDKHDPLWGWVLTKDYKAGRPALLTFRQVLNEAGLTHNVEYKENRGDRYFEFSNGSLLEFKTADDPESLRGAGLHLLWMDEAAFIPNEEAYDVVFPALADKEGIVISTTTPSGKNWFYEKFWNPVAMSDPNVGRVEYRSIDNPTFPRNQWEYIKRNYHPHLFRREFMAAFDAMAGRDLQGDWLHFYTNADLPTKEAANGKKVIDLKLYIGVDPAISQADTADFFAMALIGVSPDNESVFLLDTYKARIQFPDQVMKIQEWHHKYRPHLIGIEDTAYQRALAQQMMRLSSMPPISSVPAKGKKFERILSMAPLFKIGKIKIHKRHVDFIEQWLDYDSSIKNPRDDLLDAVEIAIRITGALLPTAPSESLFNQNYDHPAATMEELAKRNLPGNMMGNSDYYNARGWSEELGAEW